MQSGGFGDAGWGLPWGMREFWGWEGHRGILWVSGEIREVPRGSRRSGGGVAGGAGGAPGGGGLTRLFRWALKVLLTGLKSKEQQLLGAGTARTSRSDTWGAPGGLWASQGALAGVPEGRGSNCQGRGLPHLPEQSRVGASPWWCRARGGAREPARSHPRDPPRDPSGRGGAAAESESGSEPGEGPGNPRGQRDVLSLPLPPCGPPPAPASPRGPPPESHGGSCARDPPPGSAEIWVRLPRAREGGPGVRARAGAGHPQNIAPTPARDPPQKTESGQRLRLRELFYWGGGRGAGGTVRGLRPPRIWGVLGGVSGTAPRQPKAAGAGAAQLQLPLGAGGGVLPQSPQEPRRDPPNAGDAHGRGPVAILGAWTREGTAGVTSPAHPKSPSTGLVPWRGTPKTPQRPTRCHRPPPRVPASCPPPPLPLHSPRLPRRATARPGAVAPGDIRTAGNSREAPSGQPPGAPRPPEPGDTGEGSGVTEGGPAVMGGERGRPGGLQGGTWGVLGDTGELPGVAGGGTQGLMGGGTWKDHREAPGGPGGFQWGGGTGGVTRGGSTGVPRFRTFRSRCAGPTPPEGATITTQFPSASAGRRRSCSAGGRGQPQATPSTPSGRRVTRARPPGTSCSGIGQAHSEATPTHRPPCPLATPTCTAPPPRSTCAAQRSSARRKLPSVSPLSPLSPLSPSLGLPCPAPSAADASRNTRARDAPGSRPHLRESGALGTDPASPRGSHGRGHPGKGHPHPGHSLRGSSAGSGHGLSQLGIAGVIHGHQGAGTGTRDRGQRASLWGGHRGGHRDPLERKNRGPRGDTGPSGGTGWGQDRPGG